MTRAFQTTINPNIIPLHSIVKVKGDRVVEIEKYRGSIPIKYIHKLENEGFRILINPGVEKVKDLPIEEWVETVGEKFIPRNKPKKLDEIKERVLNNRDIHKYELQYMKKIVVVLYLYGFLFIGLIIAIFKEELMRLIL